MPLPSPQDRRHIEEELRLAEAARRLLGGAPTPYFAHLGLDSPDGRRDVLLGTVSRTEGALSIVDWRGSSTLRAYFECREGGPCELPLAGRTIEGVAASRSLVGFEGGALAWVRREQALLTRGARDWEQAPARRLLGARPRSRRSPVQEALSLKLDPAQRRAVELPRGAAALILGEAGCGKTTVALHRLLHLARASERRLRCAVVVPTEGLRRLIELLLEGLGAKAVEVALYDRFAAAQARRCFDDLPERESAGEGGGRVALKRDPAVRAALAQLAERPIARPDDERGPAAPPARASASREDLHHLFGDLALLEQILERAGGRLARPAIAEAFEHTRVQFSPTAEAELAHVDAARRRALDGLALDAGTPMEDAQTVDPEDYAVLFELDRLRAARLGREAASPARYDVLVIDEAQELAPLELALLGRSLSPGGTLVVAGDAQQQIDPSAAFAGWGEAMAELGAGAFETVTLEAGYRCPEDVEALARRVARLPTARSGPLGRTPHLVAARFSSDFHLLAWLVEELRALRERDPSIPVAIISRDAPAAARLARLLRHGLYVRLALDGRFDLAAGIHVTCVQEVKGLEFDTVIVPDASARAYPDTPAARRALYLALTRATRRLAVATASGFSPVLEEALGARPRLDLGRPGEG